MQRQTCYQNALCLTTFSLTTGKKWSTYVHGLNDLLSGWSALPWLLSSIEPSIFTLCSLRLLTNCQVTAKPKPQLCFSHQNFLCLVSLMKKKSDLSENGRISIFIYKVPLTVLPQISLPFPLSGLWDFTWVCLGNLEVITGHGQESGNCVFMLEADTSWQATHDIFHLLGNSVMLTVMEPWPCPSFVLHFI